MAHVFFFTQGKKSDAVFYSESILLYHFLGGRPLIAVNVREKLGFTGREEGISAYATVLIENEA